MPRPTKYTPDLASVIVAAISAGLTDTEAAAVAGVDRVTLLRWRKRNADFAARIARAKAERTRLWLRRIRDLGEAQRDWRAYAALLDRCAPEYRATVRHDHSGREDGPVMVRFVIVDERSAQAQGG
jgi:hypothetical protein